MTEGQVAMSEKQKESETIFGFIASGTIMWMVGVLLNVYFLSIVGNVLMLAVLFSYLDVGYLGDIRKNKGAAACLGIGCFLLYKNYNFCGMVLLIYGCFILDKIKDKTSCSVLYDGKVGMAVKCFGLIFGLCSDCILPRCLAFVNCFFVGLLIMYIVSLTEKLEIQDEVGWLTKISSLITSCQPDIQNNKSGTKNGGDGGFLKTLLDGVANIMAGIGHFLKNVADTVGSVLKRIWNTLKEFLTWIWGVLCIIMALVYRLLKFIISLLVSLIKFLLNHGWKWILGVICILIGFWFIVTGIFTLFNRYLITIGNILEITGLWLIFGFDCLWSIFSTCNQQSITAFAISSGIILVFFGWPFCGLIIEAVGIIYFIVLLIGKLVSGITDGLSNLWSHVIQTWRNTKEKED